MNLRVKTEYWIKHLRKCEETLLVDLDHKDCGDIADVLEELDLTLKGIRKIIDERKEQIEKEVDTK